MSLYSKIRFYKVLIQILPIFFITIYLTACSSSYDNEDESESGPNVKIKTEMEVSEGSKILSVVKEEQENKMYSPEIDSTYLYWLNNKLIILNGSSKCNIFALNVLCKCGFKTPDENALAKDLFDTAKFIDIFPVVGVKDISKARTGDIVSWYNHVIIFASLLKIANDLYALAWWAGTQQEDNGMNIKNNVCYGKYKLNGNYVVRRPVKKDF